MTRARNADCVAASHNATYYGQRAGAGLIVTEGTPVSPQGQGYAFVPGIWSDEQVVGWRGVTDRVHERSGRIFAQLWHVGRLSHSSLQPGQQRPVSASETPADGVMTYAFDHSGGLGFLPVTPPRALTVNEIESVTAEFANAAKNADSAGFDGVELHGANGYIFEQFFNPNSNVREDQYGGSIENRTRFALESVDHVIAAIGDSARVGIRLSPFSQSFDMQPYDEAEQTYLHLGQELAKRNLAYVHINDQFAGGNRVVSKDFLAKFRAAYSGSVILAGGLNQQLAEDYVAEGLIDLAAFGQPFISNPDLPERFRNNWELAVPNKDTFYGGGLEGYTDYPDYGRVSV
ncbi:alkene reductase [Gordonia sp. HY002]|nr:alkene reductase [Gordonia zhenghanii]MCF8606096.1 alkene reductase [Gordonia zhenghanii]